MKKSFISLLTLNFCFAANNNGWSDADMAAAIAASLNQPVLRETDTQMARRLQQEEDIRVAAIRRAQEEANLRAISDLQRQDRAEAQRLRAEAQTLREAQRQAENQKRLEQRALRDTLRATTHNHAEYLKSIAQGGDVHGLDTYVAANLPTFTAQVTAALPHLQKPSDLAASIMAWVGESFDYRNPENVSELLPKAEVQGLITAALTTASQDPNVLALYSLHMAIIENLRTRVDVRPNMLEFINAICENYKTQGGCFEGVRNRGFIRLTALIASYGYGWQ